MVHFQFVDALFHEFEYGEEDCWAHVSLTTLSFLAERKSSIQLTRHERPMDTPRPLYIRLSKNLMGDASVWPFWLIKQFR